MRKLLLSAVALLALSAQNAFAINLTFQFDVNSSGPSIYACNAGIKHGSTGANTCFDRTNPAKSCSAGCAAGNVKACSTDFVKPGNCVCTGEFNPTGTQGTYRMDFLQANTADWADNQDVNVTGAQTFTKTADQVATGTQFSQLFGSDKGAGNDFTINEAYKYQIKDMTVNLGSELYGAEYFVDICYRGPQIDYRQSNGTVAGLNFNLIAKATVFDIKKATNTSTAFDNYSELAGLQVRAEARCILDDNFDYCLADVLPGDSTACGTPTKESSYKFVKDFAKVNATVSTLIGETSIANGYNKTPRFCQIRYSFKETNKTAMRKWKLQQARICTYTEITEPGTK